MSINNGSENTFVKEVAKYFMNFLETDFKKRRIPKRNTIQKTTDGMKVAVDLEKYPEFKKALIKQFLSSFDKQSLIIKKREYTTKIPATLLNLILKRIDDLKKTDLKTAQNEITKLIYGYKAEYADSYDQYLEEALNSIKSSYSKIVIYPFLKDLEKPLDNLGLADENSKFQLELETLDAVFSEIEDQIVELLQKVFDLVPTDTTFDITEEFDEILPLTNLKAELSAFFENLAVTDLFSELYQIYRNSKLLDKTEIYFYFFELSLGSETFPLFYMPTIVEKDENKFTLKFEHRVYLNSQGLDFVIQEFNRQTNRKATLSADFERVIYLNEDVNFLEKATAIVKKIENFLELGITIDMEDESLQKGQNLVTGLSNKCYIFLFDKSDEALINDYETILSDDGTLIDDFTNLLNGFIENNPKSFIKEVENEWFEMPNSQKLVMQSPIPLNDEQKQVLMALQKPDCKFMILEGPPGTGKSHTITAIICKALLEEKSVLVLSDKKEALDVVEDKISNTLNKIRREDDFQNPILRLGRSEGKFYKIVQGQTIQKIKNHYLAYKKTQAANLQQKEELLTGLENNLQNTIKHFEDIDLKDIVRYFDLEEKLSEENILTKTDDLEGLEKLPQLKNIAEDLASYNNASFTINFITQENIQKLKHLSENITESQHISEILGNKKGLEASKHIEEILNRNLDEKGAVIDSLRKIKDSLDESNKLENLSKLHIIKNCSQIDQLAEVEALATKVVSTKQVFEEALAFHKNYLNKLDMIDQVVPAETVSLSESINIFEDYLEDIRHLRKPIIGYALNKNDIKQLTREFKKNFNFFNIENPEKHIDTLLAIHDLFEFINSKQADTREFFDDVLSLLSNHENAVFKEHFESFYTGLVSINNEIIKQSLPKNFRVKHLNNYIELLRLAIIAETNTKLVNSLQNVGVQIETQNLSGKANDNVNLDYVTELCETAEGLLLKKQDFEFIDEFIELHPELAETLNINIGNNINDFDFLLIEKSADLLVEVIEYKQIEQKLNKAFTSTPPDEFVNNIKTVEQLITAQMTHFLDKRIINYSQDNAGEVNTLKMVLKNKQQFPIDLFENLKKAFPCILAGIRDYAEYIPLEKNLFDLIIIDEASQVSISQALPALIRGKQIIVLGDDKQFSNVKAGNASKVTNQQYKSRIKEVFRKEKINGADTKGWETKVKENFDIKNSILKFSRFIRNYQCQLQKHFRCYPEIISYSDKYFYDNTLQCMKIRGIPIDDVIRIDVIEHDGKLDKAKNTNELEAKHIVQSIKKLKEEGFNKTLGIITPHREQVTLLFDMLNNLEDKDWIFETCKMKIMTFDTCQGEERDYIFYSMVATKEKDMLNWIFPVQFDGNKDNVKAQRLNVGFSRAKECIHFVLSKPIEDFKGEIRNALIHYRNELELSKERIVGKTDPNSPMESKVQDMFYATKFYKDNKDNIEFIPQFDLGKYLKQLDRNYNHPDYKVDFLLIYKDKKIVIEYDGFKEHFTNLDEVNVSNYKYYMSADDIYRQKVLEGYGYRFLRINRFNIGNDPVSTLNERIENIVKKN